MKRKICVVTGSRADFGLLQWVMDYLQKDPAFQLQVAATGTHLSKQHGMTVREIECAGFKIAARVSILSGDDSVVGITKSAGKALSGFSEVFNRLKPDILLMVGDRYEIHAAAQAALLARIPVAHIAGGDVTEGAFDDALRHGITKMAHLHFVTNEISGNRIRQMGENPRFIFNVGNPALDHIRKSKLLTKKELEHSLSIRFRSKNLLITFHPVTLASEPSDRQFQELLKSLESLGQNYGLIFTKPNADPEGNKISRMIDRFVKKHPNAIAKTSLGHVCYLSLLRYVDAIVGNSSSGIYEAPSFQIPTVNIGNRQAGRLKADSVIDCEPNQQSILLAIRRAMEKDCSGVVNPYGQGNSSEQIYKIIKSVSNPRVMIQKKFYTLAIPSTPKHVYIIAEAGVNHNGSLELAKKLISAAKDAGADAVKFQTFNADTLVTRSAEKAKYQKTTTNFGESQYAMLKKLELSSDDHFQLQAYCKQKKIDFLSTPFDLQSLEFLVSKLKVEKIKISSGDITNGPLLLRAARSKLPIILSTGMSTIEEIEEAVQVITEGYKADPRNCLKSNLTLLHCTTEYPAPLSDINLLSIEYLRNYFNLSVGLSDHSKGISISIAAAGRGASVIEKHLTLDKKMYGPDHKASLDPSEFKAMVRGIREVEKALGIYDKKPAESELQNREAARKSIVAARPIRQGETFTEQNLALKRPGNGISPMSFWALAGKKANKNYKKDEMILL